VGPPWRCSPGALSARLGPSPFWQSLPGILKTLAAGADSDQFGTAYATLVRGLCRHLARNLLVWGAPLLPLALLCWWGTPVLHRHFARQATALVVSTSEVAPSTPGTTPQPVTAVALGSQPLTPLGPGRYALPRSATHAGSPPLRVQQGEAWVEFADWRLPNASTQSPWAGLGLPLLGVTLSPAPSSQVGTLLVRPDYPGAQGWGWPWIAGPELAFYTGLTLGSLAAAFWTKRRSATSSATATSHLLVNEETNPRVPQGAPHEAPRKNLAGRVGDRAQGSAPAAGQRARAA